MKHRSRRAASLIEVLVVISLLSVVLSLSSTMLIASFRIHERAVKREDLNRTIARFALRLRTDAHAAASAEQLRDEKSPGIRLEIPDGRSVSYLATAGQIERRVERDDSIEHRDVFALPGFDATLTVAKQEADGQNGSLVVAKFLSLSEHLKIQAIELLPVEAAVGLLQTADSAANSAEASE